MVVEEVRKLALTGGAHQGRQCRPRLARGQPGEPCQRRRLRQHGGYDRGRIGGILQSLHEQRFLEEPRQRRIVPGQRRAQGPFVDLRGQEQLVARRGKGQ